MGVAALYETFTPYPAGAVLDLDYAQTADVEYFVHPAYPPQRLTRSGHTSWSWGTVDFDPAIQPPTGLNSTPSKPNATGAIDTTYTYEVTATDAAGVESRASTSVTDTNDLSLSGNYNTLAWTASPNAVSYTVYKGDNSLRGYIGKTDTTSFKDRNLQAVASDTAPKGTNPFGSADNYPSTVTFHQQRLWFGQTNARPNAVWGSQSANFQSLDVSTPARASDAVSFALVSEEVNAVNQLSSLGKNLIALTGNAVFAINGGGDGPITPAAINPERQTARGASKLEPIVIDNVLFYQPARFGDIRTLGWSFEIDGLRSNNVAIFSAHFFRERRIISWASQDNPFSCIWAVRDDGVLLCFTYEEEHDVWGWTRMDIDGFVEQCTVITEQGYDRLYILVRRTLNGVRRRFHERMAIPTKDLTLACHLDCSATYVYETPTNIVDGFIHLAGLTVSAVADGYAFHDLIVDSNGRITLPNDYEAMTVTAGLRYTGTMKSLPPVGAVSGGTIQVEPQNIGEVTVRAVETKGLEFSTDGEDWVPVPESTGGDLTVPEDIEATDTEFPAPGNWQKGASFWIRQAEPFPAHVTAIFYELVVSTE
jgi:hypothetical protein